MTSTELKQDMNKQTSRKRKRASSCEADDIPAAKRPRMMIWVSRRFEQKCLEWRQRRIKIAIGIMLYREAQMRNIRRMVRKRVSSEIYADYVGLVKPKYMKLLQKTPKSPNLPSSAMSSIPGTKTKPEEVVLDEILTPAPKRKLIKRLSDNAKADEVTEVNATPTQRRNGWRRKGEKRS